MEREALKLALEALRFFKFMSLSMKELKIAAEAIAAITAALAQPAQPAEIQRLTAELKKANDQAEHFEREWYLRGDEIERLKAAQPAIDPVHEYRKGFIAGQIDMRDRPEDQPAHSEWNAALDVAAAHIGEMKGFGQATQDSFAIYIKGLKK